MANVASTFSHAETIWIIEEGRAAAYRNLRKCQETKPWFCSIFPGTEHTELQTLLYFL